MRRKGGKSESGLASEVSKNKMERSEILQEKKSRKILLHSFQSIINISSLLFGVRDMRLSAAKTWKTVDRGPSDLSFDSWNHRERYQVITTRFLFLFFLSDLRKGSRPKWNTVSRERERGKREEETSGQEDSLNWELSWKEKKMKHESERERETGLTNKDKSGQWESRGEREYWAASVW